MKRRQLGTWGESLAKQYLKSKGYHIQACNWRSIEGEIDIIALDGEVLVFVEVKTRSSRTFGWPEESITESKRLRLRRVAWSYLEAQEITDVNWRIDVIIIELVPPGEIERLEHFINAVEAGEDIQ